MPRKKKEKKVNPIDITLNPKEVVRPVDPEIDDYEVDFISAEDYKKQQAGIVQTLISGTPLDDIIRLGGSGFESGTVYTFYGPNASGKTQTGYTMVVLNPYDVIWIDGGEGTFNPDRIAQIATARGLDAGEILKRIHFIKAKNGTHLEAIIAKIAETFMKLDDDKKRVFRENKLQTGRIGLIVLDSLAPLMRVQYQGREELGPRQQAILRILYYLRIITIWMNCVAIVTNQIIANPQPYQSPTLPVGGPTVAHNIDVQIKLRKAKDNMRIATLMDSSSTPLGEAAFYITDKGIETIVEDAPDETE